MTVLIRVPITYLTFSKFKKQKQVHHCKNNELSIYKHVQNLFMIHNLKYL